MFVGHSSGTTGKLSFIPKSQVEFHAFRNCHNEASRAASGVNPWNDPIETFWPGYRYGHQMGLKRSEEHTSELQSLMRISYAVFCLKKKKNARKITVQNN